MSIYVVDASVAVKWLIEEEGSEIAARVLHADNVLHAPDFLLLEVDNVLWKRVRRQDLFKDEADSARAMLRRVPLQYHPLAALQETAWLLAHRSGRSVYDCLYLALAVLLGAPLVTADRRLYAGLAGHELADRVAWVGNLR